MLLHAEASPVSSTTRLAFVYVRNAYWSRVLFNADSDTAHMPMAAVGQLRLGRVTVFKRTECDVPLVAFY